MPLNLFKSSSRSIFTDRSKAVLLLWIVFISFASCLCVICCLCVPCSLVVTCWERADLLAVVFVEFCYFPKCFLVHIRIKGEVGAVNLV